MTRSALINELKTLWIKSEKQLVQDGYILAAEEIAIAIGVLERTYTDVEKYGIQ